MYSSLDAEYEAHRTVKRAELTPFFFADPMVGYWCRVGSLALSHTRTDIFGAVAIWDQRRTMLSIFVAWLDRHGIRPSYLGLGGPPLLGLGGPSSAVGLTTLPIVNSRAESAAMLVESSEGLSAPPQLMRTTKES